MTLTNSGAGVQADNPGDEFTDVLPAGLTLTGATATGGTAVANTGTNTVTWDGSIAPLGGSVTITINATVTSAAAPTVSNQGTIAYDGDGNGTNESTASTDDPSVGGTADPTTFTRDTAVLTATKSVTGAMHPYGVVTYTIVLTNTGPVTTHDNSGDEFVDTLPASETLRGASSSSGSTSVGVNGSAATVKWNGVIAAGASVTITIQAMVSPATEFTTISNQATVKYDSYESGVDDTTILTDDPSVGGNADPTSFIVADEIFKDGFDG